MSRICLILTNRANLGLIAGLLEKRHEVTALESSAQHSQLALCKRYDLAIVDGLSLRKLESEFRRRQTAAKPFFLPLLLVTGRRGVSLITQNLWKIIDDLLIVPIEKSELEARIEVLLRARNLSLELYNRDVEKLTRSEEKYRTLFESMTEGVIYFDSTLSITLANTAAERILGLTLEQMRGKPLRELGHRTIHADGTDWPAETHPVAEAFRTGKPVLGAIQGVLISESGRDIWIRINAVPQFQAGKTKPYQVYAMLEDITEKKMVDKAIKAKDQAIRQTYVDVFDAVTGGKLIIMTPEELEEALGESMGPEIDITSYEQVSVVREKEKEIYEKQFPGMDIFCFLVGTSEALTNTVKHAGGGKLQFHKKDEVLQVVIKDKGPGINFSILPKATLMTGFSTKQSVGLGFSIILEGADRVSLATEPGRTAIVLEKSQLARVDQYDRRVA